MSRTGRDEDPAPHPGALRPTPLTTVLGWGVVGLVLGLALRPVAERVGFTPPLISWAQPLALLLLAAILGYTAWATYRALRAHDPRLLPHQAVNRLVLARACALVAALVCGGYLGYGIGWVGNPAELADERQVRCWVAAAGGFLSTAAALALERACRVREDDDDGEGDPA